MAALALVSAACGSSSSSSSSDTTGSSSTGSAAVAGSTGTAAASKGPLKLTVAVDSTGVTPIPNGAIQLAVQSGAFKKNGLNVKLVALQGTPQAIAALASGNADVANVDVDNAIQLVAKNLAQVEAVDSTGESADYILVARKSITSLTGLEGKTFAGESPGSQPEEDLNLLLEKQGSSFSTLKDVSLGSPADRVLALVNGRADATIVSQSQWASLTTKEKGCCSVLMNATQFFNALPYQSKVNVATKSAIAKKGPALQIFVNTLMQVSRDYQKDPTSWAQAVAKTRDDLTLSSLEATGNDPTFKSQWCVNGCLNSGVLTTTSAYLYRSSTLLKGLPQIPLSQWVDPTFVKTGLTQIGVFPGQDAPST